MMSDSAASALTTRNVDDSIEVVLPLRPAFASTIRVIIASLGADAGFSVDEIDDLRLGVSEVFTSLVETNEDAHADGRATATFLLGPGSVTVSLKPVDAAPGEQIELDPLAETILRSVVDDYSIDGAGILLVKHASESSADPS